MRFILVFLLSTIAPTWVIACTPISTAPAIISLPGQYCLDQDLYISGPRDTAILVQADNVTIDLRGFTISGPHAGGVAAIPESNGVTFDEVDNGTVRNGRITGFGVGVYFRSSLPASVGGLAENLDVDTISGTGILVATSSTTVQNNRLYNINGLLQSNCVCSKNAQGIRAWSLWGNSGIFIRGNSISGLKSQTPAVSRAIWMDRNFGAVIDGNFIETDRMSAYRGVYSNHSNNVMVTDNRFQGTAYAIEYYESTGKYSRNIAQSNNGGNSVYIGGTPVGDNF